MDYYSLENDFNLLISNGWLTSQEADFFQNDKDIIDAIYKSTSPKKENIFNALKSLNYSDFKVLILGKDPYPNPKDAHGYAFSSLNYSTPDSLKNIFRSIDYAYGSSLYENKNNNLINWVKQGVLLLNTGLTFQRIDEAVSSKEKKILEQSIQRKNMKIWKGFVNTIISKILSVKDRPVALMLWGKDAHDVVFKNIKDASFDIYKYSREPHVIPNSSIMLLQASHPSPLSVNRGGDFLKVVPNHFLVCDSHLGIDKIIWTKI